MQYKSCMGGTHDLKTAGKTIFRLRISWVIIWLLGLVSIPVFIIWMLPRIPGLIDKTNPEGLGAIIFLMLVVYGLLATTWEKLYFAIAGATISASARRDQLPPKWALNVIDELERRYDQHLDDLQMM